MITSKATKPNPALKPLSILIGQWKTRGSHPYVADKILHGHTSFQWMEGGAFLIMNTHLDDPRFPDGVAIIGSDDGHDLLYMLYFDERGVSRKYNFSIDENEWSWWREDRELSQRFSCSILNDGQTMVCEGRMRKQAGKWEGDLDLTYEKV